MTTKPTLILVPGAWHTPAHYELLITELTRHKFKCVTVSLPSVGPKLDEMPNSIDADIKAIRAAVTKEVASGSNVAVIAHSYGAIPAVSALEGLDAASNPGKAYVSAIALMTSFLIPAGSSLL